MRVEYLYRYPVKGLTAEALEAAEVESGQCIPWDRSFALAQGDAGFDPDHPPCHKKGNFVGEARPPPLPALFSVFEPRDGTLTIRAPDGSTVSANALSPAGQARIGAFLTAYLGDDARGSPAFR